MYFDKKEIENDINILVKKISNTTDANEYKFLKCNILLLLNIYKNVFHDDYNIVVPYNLLLEFVVRNEDKSINQIYKEEYLENRDFHDTVSLNVFEILYNCNLPENMKYKTIELDEFLDIINSFFSYCGGNLNKTYQDLINKKHIDLLSMKDDPVSETSHIFMLNKSYVILNINKDIDGLHSFAHEIGHAYAQSMIKTHKASYDDCMSFVEFYSSFMERMLTNYLIENNYSFDDINKYNKYYFTIFKKTAKDLCRFGAYDMNKILENRTLLYSSMAYFYGEYIGIIKENDYYEDKEGTLERIDDYLKYQGLVSRSESLDILGIDSEELISGNKLKKVLNKNNM